MESFTWQYSSGAQIKDVHLVLGLPHCEQHCINAILNVEVGLALLAITQHLQCPRVILELFEKVKNMTVAVTLPENRDKAKDVGLKAKTFTVCFYEPFSRQL